MERVSATIGRESTAYVEAEITNAAPTARISRELTGGVTADIMIEDI